MIDKRALRARMRAARDAFVARSPHAIAPTDAYRTLLRPRPTVAAYVPIGSEADPAPLIAAALEAGCTLALPHVVDRETPLRFLAWHSDDALVDGPFGLRQPHPERPVVAPDLILTPLVGFDAALNRLGQGAGHYDRAFAAYPAAHRIGVAWSIQQTAAILADPWDMPLHAVITERGWIERTSL